LYTNSTQFTEKGQLLPIVMNIPGSKWWSQQAYSRNTELNRQLGLPPEHWGWLLPYVL